MSAEQEIPAVVKAAVERLLSRSHRLRRRAARAAVRSNERRKCMARARWLHACATELATESSTGKAFEKQARPDMGWQATAGLVTDLARKREREALK